MGDAIQRNHLYHQVARNLALRILRGNLTTDESSTTQLKLARDLGVSRTILREAMGVLAAKGLVDVRPKMGIRVRPRGEWNLLDPALLNWQCEAGVDEEFVRNLCQVRLMLEPPTAAAAASHASDEDLQRIHRAYLNMEEKFDNFPEYMDADVEFHQQISRATRNDLLIQINRIIFDALRGTQTILENFRGPASQALALHRDVAEAILNRNAEKTHRAMYDVVKQAEHAIYLALYEQHPKG